MQFVASEGAKIGLGLLPALVMGLVILICIILIFVGAFSSSTSVGKRFTLLAMGACGIGGVVYWSKQQYYRGGDDIYGAFESSPLVDLVSGSDEVFGSAEESEQEILSIIDREKSDPESSLVTAVMAAHAEGEKPGKALKHWVGTKLGDGNGSLPGDFQYDKYEDLVYAMYKDRETR